MRKKIMINMKESVRNTKSRDQLSKNSRDIRKNNGNA